MAEAARMNNGKPQLSYLLEFPTAITAFARVKELGAAKYERGNWKKGGKPDHEYLDACMRHLTAFMEGEKVADDSGCLHLAHAAWNLFALMELNYPGETCDQELFDKMIEYWKQQRKNVTFELKDAERLESFEDFKDKYMKPYVEANPIDTPELDAAILKRVKDFMVGVEE